MHIHAILCSFYRCIMSLLNIPNIIVTNFNIHFGGIFIDIEDNKPFINSWFYLTNLFLLTGIRASPEAMENQNRTQLEENQRNNNTMNQKQQLQEIATFHNQIFTIRLD